MPVVRAEGLERKVPKAGWHGGENGIRTRDTLARIHAFQACSFSHSDISPRNSSRSYSIAPKDQAIRPHRPRLLPA